MRVTEYSMYWKTIFRSRLQWLKLSLAMLLLFFCALSHAEEKAVVLVYQQDKSFSVNIAELIADKLQQRDIAVERVPLKTLDQAIQAGLDDSSMIVSLGSEATYALHKKQLTNPVLSLLIPKQSYDALLKDKPRGSPWAVLFIDQPISRQFLLIKHLLGEDKTIGALLGPYSIREKSTLKNIARSHGQDIQLEEINITDQLISSLKTLIKDTDVLLALPDPVAFNRNTIRGILLLTYREDVPVIGFSRSYVKAGAIAALFSEFEQIAGQAVDIISTHLGSGKFAKTRFYPNDFSIALNRKVARTLNINLKTEDTLIRLIKRDERRQ